MIGKTPRRVAFVMEMVPYAARGNVTIVGENGRQFPMTDDSVESSLPLPCASLHKAVGQQILITSAPGMKFSDKSMLERINKWLEAEGEKLC